MAQPTQFQMKINLEDLPLKECCCGHTFFVPRLQIRFVSKLQSPSGEAQYLMTQAGFECALCGDPIDLNVAKENPVLVS